MLALAFGWAVGCLCFAHLPMASSSASYTAQSGPLAIDGSAAEYDQPVGLKVSLDINLHDLCEQVLKSLALSATTQFAGAAMAATASWAVYTKWTKTAARVRAALQDRPPGEGLAERVARRAHFLISTWNASGLRADVATGLLLLSAFLYKEWWEGILAALLCVHALRVWRGQELDQPPSVRRYHLLLAAHVVIGSMLAATCIASGLAWLGLWVLPLRWLSLMPGRLLRAAFTAYFTSASVSLRHGVLADLGPPPDSPGKVSAVEEPGADLAYRGDPQFWTAAAYPLATLLRRGHTWLPLLLVASCCGGWWAALLAQGTDRDRAEGSADALLREMLSGLPTAKQVLLGPWVVGGVVKGTPPPLELVSYWRGTVKCNPSICTRLLHGAAAMYQLLGVLPARMLCSLHLAPQWFPEYIGEVLGLIAFQASVPFGALSLLLRSSLHPMAVLLWPVSVPIGCICAAMLAYMNLRWIGASSLALLDWLGMAPVSNSLRFVTACVKVLALICFSGIALLALGVYACLKWLGVHLAYWTAVLLLAVQPTVLRAAGAVKTMLLGLRNLLGARKSGAATAKQRRGSGGRSGDRCLGTRQPGAKEAAPKQKGSGKKAGKAAPPASKAAPSSPAAAAASASKAGQSSQPTKASPAKAVPGNPAAPAAVVAVQPPLQQCNPTPALGAAAEQGPAGGAPHDSASTGYMQQVQRRRRKQQRKPTQPTETAPQLQEAAPAALPSSQPSRSSSDSSAVGSAAAGFAPEPQAAQPAQVAPATSGASSSQAATTPATLSAPAKPAPDAAGAGVPAAASPASVAAGAAAGEGRVEDRECVLCLDRGVQCVLVPCGHLCLCLGCTHLLFGADGSGRGGSCQECPVCRQQVQQWVKVHC